MEEWMCKKFLPQHSLMLAFGLGLSGMRWTNLILTSISTQQYAWQIQAEGTQLSQKPWKRELVRCQGRGQQVSCLFAECRYNTQGNTNTRPSKEKGYYVWKTIQSQKERNARCIILLKGDTFLDLTLVARSRQLKIILMQPCHPNDCSSALVLVKYYSFS